MAGSVFNYMMDGQIDWWEAGEEMQDAHLTDQLLQLVIICEMKFIDDYNHLIHLIISQHTGTAKQPHHPS